MALQQIIYGLEDSEHTLSYCFITEYGIKAIVFIYETTDMQSCGDLDENLSLLINVQQLHVAVLIGGL